MNTLTKAGLVAVILAGSAAPVLAQDTSSSAATSSSMAASSETAAVDYAAVLAGLQAGSEVDLTTVTETSTINLVLVSDLKANGDATAVEDAIKTIGDAAAALKANVDTNAAIKAKVTEAGFMTDLVVAVLANADGSFTVVVNDQHP